MGVGVGEEDGEDQKMSCGRPAAVQRSLCSHHAPHHHGTRQGERAGNLWERTGKPETMSGCGFPAPTLIRRMR